MTENLKVVFWSDAAGMFDASALVFDVEKTARGVSAEYGHADGEATIKARYDALLLGFVDVSVPRSVYVTIETTDGEPVFYGVCTGRITRARTTDADGNADISIEALDFGDALRVPVPSDVIIEGHKVAPASGVDSIAAELVALAGIEFDGFDFSAGECADIVGGLYVAAGETVYDVLTKILFEHGRAWTAGPDKKIHIVDMTATPTFAAVIDDTNARAISTERSEEAAAVLSVQYYTQETKTARPNGDAGFPLYVEKLPYDSENNPYGVIVQPGRYYPTEFEISDDVKQDYTSAAYAYVLRYYELTRNAKPQMIYAKDMFIEEAFTAGIVRHVSELGHKSARVVYKNTGTIDARLIRFAVYGTARMRKSLVTIKATALGGTGTAELSLDYVSDIAIAERFVTLHARRLNTSARVITAEVSEAVAIAPGDYVQIVAEAGTLAGDVIEVSEQAGKAFKTVTIQGRALAAVVPIVDISTLPGDTIATIETAIDNALTPGDIIEGFDAGGGSTLPEVPTVIASGAYRGTSILASTTRAQTGRIRFEAQVAAATGGPWYELAHGVTWHGAVGADTDSSTGLFVHAPLPLPTDTDGAALPLALYYRVRVVTTNETTPAGDWSAIVSAVASPVDAGTIAVNAITAANIQAGVLNAILAQIKETLVIDNELGYVARLDGDKRVRINENGVFVEAFTPTTTLLGASQENDIRADDATTIMVFAPKATTENEYAGRFFIFYDETWSVYKSILLSGNSAAPVGKSMAVTFSPTRVGFITDGEGYRIVTQSGTWGALSTLSADASVSIKNGLALRQGTGQDAIIVGRGTNTATNINSIAFGVDNTVTNINSEAFGKNNWSTGDASCAFGDWNYATAQYATAFGKSNRADGIRSSAHGFNNQATGHDASAFGGYNYATGLRATAVGHANTASGEDSVAVGKGNVVNGASSTATGVGNTINVAGSRININIYGSGNTVSCTNANTLFSNITIVGSGNYFTDVGGASTQNCAIFGHGSNMSTSSSNEIIVGNFATSYSKNSVSIGGAGQQAWAYYYGTRSDRREKIEIEDIPESLGIEFVRKLKPRRYKMNPRDLYIDENGIFDAEAHGQGEKRGVRWHTGFIAQEFKEALDSVGEDCAAFADASVTANGDAMGIGYIEVVAILARAIQEQDGQIAALTARVEAMGKTKDKGTE